MKIKYEFATETTEIEVNEEWATILIDLDKQEFNNNRRETRRHNSLDGYAYEPREFSVHDANLLELLGRNDDEDKLYAALERLTPKQRELVHKVYFEGYSMTECGEIFGVHKSAISRRMERIQKKIKKFIKECKL